MNLLFRKISVLCMILACPFAYGEGNYTIKVENIYTKEETTYKTKEDFEIPLDLEDMKCSLSLNDGMWKTKSGVRCVAKDTFLAHHVSCDHESNSTVFQIGVKKSVAISHLKKLGKYKNLTKKDRDFLNSGIKSVEFVNYFYIRIGCGVLFE